MPRRPLRLETIKDRQTGILFAVRKVLPSGSPLHIPSCNESFQLRAGSINRSALSCKRGRRCLVALSACEQIKDRQTGFCLPSVKCCRSHPLCICYVAPNASRDELEAPITAFSGGKEGDVASSPSPLGNNQRSANRYFVCRQESAAVRMPLHLLCCNEGFQRRAGSTNHCVFRWKRGRRCLVALSAWKQSKIGKQVFCLPSGKCSLRGPLCIYLVAMKASSYALEASIAAL